jgi:catechol 2,3-dioxygenase-like lactoylglutathione lyase family enzyme
MSGSFRIAAIFPTTNLERSLNFYQRLGFTTRQYQAGGYGFASRNGVELHLGEAAPGDDRPFRSASAYLFVDDADALAAEWQRAGVDVHAPEDAEWRKHEGAVVDPDGNVIRSGSTVQ